MYQAYHCIRKTYYLISTSNVYMCDHILTYYAINTTNTIIANHYRRYYFLCVVDWCYYILKKPVIGKIPAYTQRVYDMF